MSTFAVDFDNTLIAQDRPYDDVETPLQWKLGARYMLAALKRAHHIILIFSARANRALRDDPTLDPLVRAGVVEVNWREWREQRPVHEARYRQMVAFLESEEAEGLWDAYDDGVQGKPVCDYILDDRGICVGYGAKAMSLEEIAETFGEPDLSRGMTTRVVSRY